MSDQYIPKIETSLLAEVVTRVNLSDVNVSILSMLQVI
jgi:hypothetical protein